MPYTFILYSQSLDRFYIGSTELNPEERLTKHLSIEYGNKSFTSKASDWVVFWSVYTDNIIHARRIETKLKQMKSRVYLQNLVKYPELATKIFNDTL